MEYAAGVKKAQYNKVKLENRKMLIKPSYLITAVGIAFCVDVYKRQGSGGGAGENVPASSFPCKLPGGKSGNQ